MNYADMNIYYGTKCKLFYEAYRSYCVIDNTSNVQKQPSHIAINSQVHSYVCACEVQIQK